MGDQRVLTEDEAFDLLAFLLATAELCTNEPIDYAPRRLVEAVDGLVAAMARDSSSESAEWLAGFKQNLEEAQRARTLDHAAYIAFLRSATGEVARELIRRAERSATKGNGNDGA